METEHKPNCVLMLVQKCLQHFALWLTSGRGSMILTGFFIIRAWIFFFIVPLYIPVAVQVYSLVLWSPGTHLSFIISVFADSEVSVFFLEKFRDKSKPIHIKHRNENNLYPLI